MARLYVKCGCERDESGADPSWLVEGERRRRLKPPYFASELVWFSTKEVVVCDRGRTRKSLTRSPRDNTPFGISGEVIFVLSINSINQETRPLNLADLQHGNLSMLVDP